MDARTIFTPSHTLPWGSSIWRLHRHGGVPTRLPVNLSAFKAPWKPTRRFGCLKPNMECVAWKQGRFLHRHEPVVGVLGLAVKPPRRGANASCRQFGGSQSTVGSHPNPGCLKYSMGCVSQTCDRFNRRHEPLAVGAARCFV